MKTNLVSILLCITLLANVSCYAAVEIRINDSLYQYPDEVRLSQVLQPVAQQDLWYWPASRLFDQSNPDAYDLKKDVLRRITQLEEKYKSGHYSTALVSLKKQIIQWEVAHRIHISIDFDSARLVPKENPAFLSGQYRLNLTTRPKNILVIDTTSSVDSMSYEPQSTPSFYLNKLVESKSRSKSWCYLILPNGLIKKVGIAYWNREFIQVMPGTQIFYPLQERFFDSEIKLLNEDIAKLAVHRVIGRENE